MTDAFDPNTVPPFPVVTLDLTDDSSILVDGRPIDIGMDEAPTEAGIAAVAEVARQNGVSAIRVRATSPDGSHPMVITAEGRAYDLDVPDEPTAGRSGTRGTPRRRALLGAVAAFVIVLVVAGTGVTVFALAHRTAPTAVATGPATPPGYRANLPVLSPPGYSQQAAFAVATSQNVAPVLLTDGRLAIVDGSGNLRILNGSTGATTWRGKGGPSGQAGITQTSVENRPVIASASSDTLTLWPLDEKGTGAVAPATVTIGAQADVSYLGSAPLVVLSDQTVALLTSKGVLRRDVPVLATPILATQNSVVAANADSWWRIPESGTTRKYALPRPQGATGTPDLLSAADDTHLIVVWPTKVDDTDIATVVDLSNNTITATANVDPSTAQNTSAPIHSATSKTLTVGQLFINYGSNPQIVALDTLTPAAVDGSTVYGTVSRAPSVSTLSAGTFTTKPFTTLDTDDTTLPAAITSKYAYVVAEKVDKTLIYAMPRQTQGEK